MQSHLTFFSSSCMSESVYLNASLYILWQLVLPLCCDIMYELIPRQVFLLFLSFFLHQGTEESLRTRLSVSSDSATDHFLSRTKDV